MDSSEPARFDPNEPDRTNGDYFCRLCLSSQNSESMWSSHIAGKRHIKNAQKFPNGLPRGDIEENSYERPPNRDRFDDRYDDYSKYGDDYYDDSYYKARPPDYRPAVKPTIIVDYGHNKTLEETVPPELTKIIQPPPPPVILPPTASISRPLPVASSVNTSSVLDHLFLKSDKTSDIKDDFFEKLNQREMAKELAKELTKKGMSLDSFAAALDTSENIEELKLKIQSSKNVFDKHDRRSPDICDDPYEKNEKKRSAYGDPYEKNEKKKSAYDDPYEKNEKKRAYDDSYKNEKKRSKYDDSYDKNEKKRSKYDDPYEKKRSKYDEKEPKKKSTASDVLDILYKSQKRSKYDEKDSKKSSLSSSPKSKSVLDDIDPDELTTDVLDALLSAHLKPKKPDNPVVICNRKHVDEINLDDPKIIAEKLEELPAIEFLNIIHNKLVNLDLKSPEELKMLLKVIAEAQVAVCKKLPPELQALVKAKFAGQDDNTSQVPVQNPVTSQNQSVKPIGTPNIAISKNSVPSLPPSSSSTVSLAPAFTVASSKSSTVQAQPTVQVQPPISQIHVALNQHSNSPASKVAFSQNQVSLSHPSSVMSSAPIMTPVQMGMAPMPLTTIAPLRNAPSQQNLESNAIHNYYNSIFALYQNRQFAPVCTPNMYAHQPVPIFSRLPPPPPPPPPRPPQLQTAPKTQLSQEVLNAVAKITAERTAKEYIARQLKQQQSSVSSDSQSKIKETLKNLDSLEQEYKRKKIRNISK